MYNKASILNRKMAMSLLLLLLIINMKTIAIIAIVGIALPMKLELCWSQFQLQRQTFHFLHHTFFHQPKWKLQDPPQTPPHFNFQYLIVIILGIININSDGTKSFGGLITNDLAVLPTALHYEVESQLNENCDEKVALTPYIPPPFHIPMSRTKFYGDIWEIIPHKNQSEIDNEKEQNRILSLLRLREFSFYKEKIGIDR